VIVKPAATRADDIIGIRTVIKQNSALGGDPSP
jgi:hypothetical protein